MHTVNHFYSMVFTLFWDFKKIIINETLFVGTCNFLESRHYKYVEQLNNMKHCMINIYAKYYGLRTTQRSKKQSSNVDWNSYYEKTSQRQWTCTRF